MGCYSLDTWEYVTFVHTRETDVASFLTSDKNRMMTYPRADTGTDTLAGVTFRVEIALNVLAQI